MLPKFWAVHTGIRASSSLMKYSRLFFKEIKERYITMDDVFWFYVLLKFEVQLILPEM